MAEFKYTARSKTGEKVAGRIKSLDKAAALKEVERMGLFPITIDQTDQPGSDARSLSRQSREPLKHDLFQLRAEYQELQKNRKRWSFSSIGWGILGFIALYVTFQVRKYSDLWFTLRIAAIVSFGIGFAYAAIYKGRSWAWGVVGVMMCYGVLILFFLKDHLKERMNELNAELKALGEEI